MPDGTKLLPESLPEIKIGLSSNVFCSIQLRAILQEVPMKLIDDMCFKITLNFKHNYL